MGTIIPKPTFVDEDNPTQPESTENNRMPFPDKKYSVIYADPAWFHNTGNISSGSAGKRQWISSVRNHYPVMKTPDICNLPVKDIADNDCLLFLWVSAPLLLDAIQVGEAWGFKYITIGFVWDKQKSMIGHYTMSQCEFCLIFKRGKIPQPRGKRNIRQFLSVKKGRHSAKPYEVRHRITEMFPHHEKIELFARERFDGWDAWGNEV